MKSLLLGTALFAMALPAAAQNRMDVFFDVEGVKRTGGLSNLAPGVTRFEPQFQNGGGVGGGLNWFFTDRVSLEGKVAGLGTRTRIRIVGSDFVATADLGWAQIYPISAVLQWHLLEHGTVRPYIGAGVVHTILKSINKRFGPSATGIHFDDPTGVVVDGGLELNISKKWNVLVDGRYVPIESKSKTTFPGTSSSINLSVRPTILSFGLGYRF